MRRAAFSRAGPPVGFDMRILLLRASEDAARSAAGLQKNGHRPLLSPVIEIVPTGLPLPSGRYDALIATSAQAFKFLSREDAQQLKPLPLLCAGSRTAVAALKNGLGQASVIAPDVKSLAGDIAAKFSPPAHLLYLAGEDRKPDLEEALAAGGFQLTLHEIYGADAADKLNSAALNAIEHGEIDAILHYSRRSAEIFLHLAKDAHLDLSQSAHVCLSADVAAPLAEAGLERIIVADTPNEAALFAKLTGFSLC